MNYVCSNFLVILAVLASFGCGGPKPEPIIPEPTPAEVPLPPSSGTPIGMLIDDATKLSLRTDQLDKLREIDDTLMARNDQLDARQRRYETLGVPPSEMRARQRKGLPGSKAATPPGGGSAAAASGPAIAAVPPEAPQGGLDPSLLQRFSDEKDANTKAAIARALDVLDPDQRELAEQILDERGVKREPDPADPAAGSGSAVPYEP